MVEPHSRKDIENYAAKIKDLLGMKNTLYVPIIRVAELIIPRIDSSFNCYPVYNEEMPQKYAEYRPKTNELVVRQDVYDAVCKDDTRHRFTIAHELGHYFLHDDVSFSRCQDDVEIPKYRDPEWQANVFASAFLINRDLMQGMSVPAVSKYFGVSHQAAEIAVKTAKRAKLKA